MVSRIGVQYRGRTVMIIARTAKMTDVAVRHAVLESIVEVAQGGDVSGAITCF